MKPPRSIQRLYPQVVKCTDAKLPVAVEVTKKDVSGADSKEFDTCALARAVCREWKADAAVIGLSSSYVIKGKTAVRFKTPISVQREIVSFDRNHDFRPGKYHLGAFPKSQARKPKSSDGRPRSSTRNHKPVRHHIHGETLGVRHMKKDL